MDSGLSLLHGVGDGADAFVQTARHTDGEGPAYDAPFLARLRIQRDGRGTPCGVWIEGVEFAEFDPRCQAEGCEGDVEYHAEEFILRILRIEGRDVARPAGLSESQVRTYDQALAAGALDPASGATPAVRLANRR